MIGCKTSSAIKISYINIQHVAWITTCIHLKSWDAIIDTIVEVNRRWNQGMDE